MTIDYDLYDMKRSFRVNDAIKLWCEIEQVNERNKKRYNIMKNTMISAIVNGELPCVITDHEYETYGKDYIPEYVDPYGHCVEREDLIAWAESVDQKPKFLFPEMRNVKKKKMVEISKIPDEIVIKKEIQPRPNQLIKARCQAIASLLWEMHPQLTQKEMIAHPQFKKHGYGNASFDERTFLLWVSEVDTRPEEVRKTPFRKAEKQLATS